MAWPVFARFSFGGGSALAAANHFPFNVTFEGGTQSLPLVLPAALHPMLTLLHTTGGTPSFASAPVVAGVATAAVEYVHSTRAEFAGRGCTMCDSCSLQVYAQRPRPWIPGAIHRPI